MAHKHEKVKGCPDCELEDAVTAILIGRDVSNRRARSIAREILQLIERRHSDNE